MKMISVYWSLLVGLLAVAAQVITYFVRFGHWNTVSPFEDYLFFFLAGTLGGWILIYFLNRQASTAARWIVLVAFLLASPIALTVMIAGGLLGGFGVFLFPQVPWTLSSLLGSWVGRFVSRRGGQ
jgi:hypothetical protein